MRHHLEYSAFIIITHPLSFPSISIKKDKIYYLMIYFKNILLDISWYYVIVTIIVHNILVMVEQFSMEAFIFILILIVYVLTAHLIEVQKVFTYPLRLPFYTNQVSPSSWAFLQQSSLNMYNYKQIGTRRRNRIR
jgi:hypothetical protein